MIRHGDYILSHIGPAGQGKRDIRETSTHWEGLNSSSLLEPVVLLYNLTGKSRFLDFARYIVEQAASAPPISSRWLWRISWIPGSTQ